MLEQDNTVEVVSSEFFSMAGIFNNETNRDILKATGILEEGKPYSPH